MQHAFVGIAMEQPREEQQHDPQRRQPGGEGPELYSIFVGDMALKITDQQLQDHFKQFFPSVNSAKVRPPAARRPPFQARFAVSATETHVLALDD